jgi:hypothetical protein
MAVVNCNLGVNAGQRNQKTRRGTAADELEVVTQMTKYTWIDHKRN